MPCVNHHDRITGLAPCVRCGRDLCPDCRVEIQGNLYCATCKEEQLGDMLSGATTTELQFASLGRRGAAWIIDGMIKAIPFFVVFAVSFGFAFAAASALHKGTQGSLPMGSRWLPQILLVGTAIAVMLGPLYEGMMLQFRRGQTVGKNLMGIRVVTPEGQDLTGSQAWIRTVMRFIFFILVIIDYIPALFSDERKTLHDKIAKTRVVNWSR